MPKMIKLSEETNLYGEVKRSHATTAVHAITIINKATIAILARRIAFLALGCGSESSL